jgi:hypothetical protein
MSPFDWFAVGVCVGLGGQWIGKLLTDQQRGRIIYGRKPAPPAGPPKQPLAAQLIRYWTWEQEQIRRAGLDLRMGEPWPEDCKPAPELHAVPPALVRDWINRHGVFRTVSTGGQPKRTGTNWGMVIIEAARWGQQQGWEACNATETASQPPPFTEGGVQRGQGNGGPSTEKPAIVAKPQPHGGRMVGDDLCPPPPSIKPRFPSPRIIREDFLPSQPDGRDPDCVAAWPDCVDGEYDPRCCRFPKSCSCGPR